MTQQIALPSHPDDIVLAGNILEIGNEKFNISPEDARAISDKILKGGARFPYNMRIWYRWTYQDSIYSRNRLILQGDVVYDFDIDVCASIPNRFAEKCPVMDKSSRFYRDGGEEMLRLNVYDKPSVSFSMFERDFFSKAEMRNYTLPAWTNDLGLIEVKRPAPFSDDNMTLYPKLAEIAYTAARKRAH